jgi:ligand-binding SRPBCC domain-containing protein
MKKTLTQTSFIGCSAEELFDFHTDSANIKAITPPNTKVQLLNEDTTTYEGKVIRLKTTRLTIPTYWDVEIQKLERPNILIDLALRSPLKYWRHQHIFTQKNEGCELCDIIEYELPFGILGRLIVPLFERDIKQMFEYRHKRTKEILEK